MAGSKKSTGLYKDTTGLVLYYVLYTAWESVSIQESVASRAITCDWDLQHVASCTSSAITTGLPSKLLVQFKNIIICTLHFAVQKYCGSKTTYLQLVWLAHSACFKF